MPAIVKNKFTKFEHQIFDRFLTIVIVSSRRNSQENPQRLSSRTAFFISEF